MAVKFTEVQPGQTILIDDLFADRKRKLKPKRQDVYVYVLGRRTKKHNCFHPKRIIYTQSGLSIPKFDAWMQRRFINYYIVKFLITNHIGGVETPGACLSEGIVRITLITPKPYVGVKV